MQIAALLLLQPCAMLELQQPMPATTPTFFVMPLPPTMNTALVQCFKT
jgi:hypothetical protein